MSIGALSRYEETNPSPSSGGTSFTRDCGCAITSKSGRSGALRAGRSLVQGWAVEKACRLATATAALVATGLGTDAGVVNLEQTIRAMETLALLD